MSSRVINNTVAIITELREAVNRTREGWKEGQREPPEDSGQHQREARKSSTWVFISVFCIQTSQYPRIFKTNRVL